MHRCILESPSCNGRIEWNHAFTYAGKRQNEPWGILPMCSLHHRQEAQYRLRIADVMRMRINQLSSFAAVKAKYPKTILV